jgi:hypothetical protein
MLRLQENIQNTMIQEKFNKDLLLRGYLEQYKILFNTLEFNNLIDQLLETIIAQQQISNDEIKNGILEVFTKIDARTKITQAILSCDFILPQRYKSLEKSRYADDVTAHILACFNGIVFEKEKNNQNL